MVADSQMATNLDIAENAAAIVVAIPLQRPLKPLYSSHSYSCEPQFRTMLVGTHRKCYLSQFNCYKNGKWLCPLYSVQ